MNTVSKNLTRTHIPKGGNQNRRNTVKFANLLKDKFKTTHKRCTMNGSRTVKCNKSDYRS